MPALADPVVRVPFPSEFDDLHRLCMRSKAYWGYDAAFMALCAPVLCLSPHAVAAGLAVVAEKEGVALGVGQVRVDGPEADLDLMFVAPEAMGLGIGRRLFRALCERARAAGARRLDFLADPGARPFYERMGALYLGDAPSDAIPGRSIPSMTFDLSGTTPPGTSPSRDDAPAGSS